MHNIDSKINPEDMRSSKVLIEYPYININDLNKCIPIVVSALEQGSCPLVGTLNGVTKVVKKIANSALNMHKLLRVTTVSLVVSSEETIQIDSIVDYMEAMSTWI